MVDGAWARARGRAGIAGTTRGGHRRPDLRRSEAEEAIAKTVAEFLNAQGGTLLIGVRDHPVEAVELDADCTCVKPRNTDGFVNWLDTMLPNNLGHAGAHRVVTRIDIVDGYDVCRVDVPASSKPIWATFQGHGRVLFERRNNSTRRVPDADIDAFIAERFGSNRSGTREPRGRSAIG